LIAKLEMAAGTSCQLMIRHTQTQKNDNAPDQEQCARFFSYEAHAYESHIMQQYGACNNTD
jgi:hypothetical protein